MKIGIIREAKTPPDSRAPLIPQQCAKLLAEYPMALAVEPSPIRCYANSEYREEGIPLLSDLSDCDILLGVKEVPVELLITGKTYFFFSHTIKQQVYNRKLLQAILKKGIRLIDYEALTDLRGYRVIAFGYFAGMVGAHNGIWTYGRRTGLYRLKRMKDCHDYQEARQMYKKLQLPPIKIVLTGTGRVGSGAARVLDDMGIQRVSPQEYLEKVFNIPVYTQLECGDYAARKDGQPFRLDDFFASPQTYKSIFASFAQASDIMINGIFWDNRAPAFFTKEEMGKDDFAIRVIADVTCDIAPLGSIPATLRPSTIADPVFGYDPNSGRETAPHLEKSIDMMTIDNLPNEMPRDASKAFGKQFIEHVFPELFKAESQMLERATVAQNGQLGRHFQYLQAFVDGG